VHIKAELQDVTLRTILVVPVGEIQRNARF